MEKISIIPQVPSDLDLSENERLFAKAIDNYWHTDITKHSEQFYKEQMDTIWWCVYKACTCVCKSIYKSRGTIVDDLDEVIMDSTEYTMRFLTGKNRLGITNGDYIFFGTSVLETYVATPWNVIQAHGTWFSSETNVLYATYDYRYTSENVYSYETLIYA